jgi:serine/threonine protein kinase
MCWYFARHRWIAYFLEETDQKKYRGPMPATQKDVCLQLAKGMEHIHEQRLIHRDVKPENVLIWVDFIRAKVLMKWADFGFSKPVSERGTHSISGSKGTDGWRAPETCMTADGGVANDAANPIRPKGTVKSDVFSEGLVFGYYLLGGIHPFRGRYEHDTQINIIENRFNLNGMFHFINQILMTN